MWPPRDSRPKAIGRLGQMRPSLLRHNLSRSMSCPQACRHDMNSWAISMVRLFSEVLRVFGLPDPLSALPRPPSFLANLGETGLNPALSALALILSPTFSTLSFTLAKNPAKHIKNIVYRTDDRIFHTVVMKLWHSTRILAE